MISYRFPKAFRLLTKQDFRLLKGVSRRYVGKCLCIDFCPSPKAYARLGITASGRYGDSWERNRFKRLVREAFRKARPAIPPCELHVIPRQAAKQASLVDIAVEFEHFLTANF